MDDFHKCVKSVFLTELRTKDDKFHTFDNRNHLQRKPMAQLLIINVIVTWIIIVFLLIVILAVIRKVSPKELKGLLKGASAPELNLTDFKGQG